MYFDFKQILLLVWIVIDRKRFIIHSNRSHEMYYLGSNLVYVATNRHHHHHHCYEKYYGSHYRNSSREEVHWTFR